MLVSYHPAVADELIAAAEYYEERQKGLGFSLRAEYQRGIERICAAPKQPAQLFPDIRGIPLRRFPYWILYRLEGEIIRVIVLRHRSRDFQFGLDRE